MELTPEEKQRLYLEEKARSDARLVIAHQRKYGGPLGKFLLLVNVLGRATQILLSLLVLVIVGWLVWAAFISHH